MKKLSEYSEMELKKWYYSYLKQEREKCFPDIYHAERVEKYHDIWSLYDYGGIFKVVYIKSHQKTKTRKSAISRDETYKPTTAEEDARFSQSISRTKSRIFELSMCNEFTYFCTFTQDKEKRDRFDLAEFRKDFAQLVRNINRGREDEDKIKYLLIPEQHKNGAWHMHGLIKGLSSADLKPFELSEHIPERIKKSIRNGKPVFDWVRYRRAFGYFTASKIENNTACSKYITKYISKDLQKTVRESGEHLFFASQGLNGRYTVVKNSEDECPVKEWDYENDYVAIKEIKIDPENGDFKF